MDTQEAKVNNTLEKQSAHITVRQPLACLQRKEACALNPFQKRGIEQFFIPGYDS
jgi:hypothetical protein